MAVKSHNIAVAVHLEALLFGWVKKRHDVSRKFIFTNIANLLIVVLVPQTVQEHKKNCCAEGPVISLAWKHGYACVHKGIPPTRVQ